MHNVSTFPSATMSGESSQDAGQDIQALMEHLFISGKDSICSSLSSLMKADQTIKTVKWTRTKHTESLTLSRTQDRPADNSCPSGCATPCEHGDNSLLMPPVLPSQLIQSLSLASPNVVEPPSSSTSLRSSVLSEHTGSQLDIHTFPIPSPSELARSSQPASAYYVITQGQEVSIFYDW